jgi:hypothetical protein
MKLNSVAGCTDILLLRNAEGRHWATFVERLIRQQKYVIKLKKKKSSITSVNLEFLDQHR